MQKKNKILMRVVAVLLILVIITTCCVSSVFAKFVLEKETKLNISFNKLGIKVDIYNSDAVTATKTDTTGDSVAITYSALNINPGVTYDDYIVRFVFSGQQNMPIKVTFMVNIDTNNKFLINTADFDSIDSVEETLAYMPMQFVCGTVANKDATSSANAVKTEAWSVHTSATDGTNSLCDETVAKELVTNLKGKLGTTNVSDVGFDGTSAYVSKTFAKTDTVAFADNAKGIGFGFEWAFGDASDTSAEAALHNAIENYLAKQFGANDIPINITFTVKIEQTGA